MHRSDLRLSSHGLLSSLVTSLLPKDASRVGLIQYDLIFTKHATTLLPTRPYSEILGIHPRTHTKAYRLGRHRSTCPLNPAPPHHHTHVGGLIFTPMAASSAFSEGSIGHPGSPQSWSP